MHQRALSFTDDSTDVETPRSIGSCGLQTVMGDVQAATELVRLFQAASGPYMALYQSGPEGPRDPWSTILSALRALDQWEYDLRGTALGEAVKGLLHAEMLYTKIVLLSSNRLELPIEGYRDFLIFDIATRYSQMMSLIVANGVNASFCTSYDLLRAIFVAQKLVDVLPQCDNAFSRDTMPPLPPSSDSTLVPRLTIGTGRERLVTALNTFSALEIIVEILGRKYKIPKTWMESKHRFSNTYNDLALDYNFDREAQHN